MNDINLIAALAVFRKLYDDKKSIYDILYNFIISIIFDKNIQIFSLRDMKEYLKEIYNFEIPDSIIKTTLKRKDGITLSNEIYSINYNILKNNNFVDENISLASNTNNDILDIIHAYVENYNKKKIDKKEIMKSLCSILLDNKEAYIKFYDEINACIIINEANKDFIKHLNCIREGLILYMGIQYSIDINNLGTWENELTIYCDTSVLFHFAGYNGNIYKELFWDFFKLIKEINIKNINKHNIELIHIKYFQDTKQQIEDYFNAAIDIIEHKNISMNPDMAMQYLLKDSKISSDIISKKANFYNLLKRNNIEEESIEIEYSSPDNIQYFEDFNTIFNSLDLDEISKNKIYSNILNNINILRKGDNNKKIEKIRYIFLTSNKKILLAANKDKKDKNYKTDLTIDLDNITNLFWFKLNKGLGNNTPINMDILIQSRNAISASLSKQISVEYAKIKKDIEQAKQTDEATDSEKKDRFILELAMLKESHISSELITHENVEEVLYNITDFDIESILKEKEFMNKELEKNKTIIADKDTEISNINKELKEARLKNIRNEIENDHKIKKENIAKKLKVIKCKKIFCSFIAFILIFLLIRYILINHFTYIRDKINNIVSETIIQIIASAILYTIILICKKMILKLNTIFKLKK